MKTNFGEKKHITHLLADLQRCRQGPSETVGAFALRIETQLGQLLTEVTLSVTRKADLSGRIGGMEELALHTFLLGLMPKISSFVRGKDPKTLNEAINCATSEEKIQRINMFEYQNTFKPQSPQTQIRPHNSPQRHNQSQPQKHFRPPTQVTCNYCKNLGHTIDQCRKRQYKNKFQSNSQPSGPRPNFPNSNFRPQYNYPVNMMEHRPSQHHGENNYLALQNTPHDHANSYNSFPGVANPQEQSNHLNE